MPVNAIRKAKPITFEQWTALISPTVAVAFEKDIRRKGRRYSVVGDLSARFTLEGKKCRRRWTLIDISQHGLSAKAHNEVPVGLKVNLIVNVDGQPIALTGHVVHGTETPGGFKIGIRLYFPDDPDAALHNR